jgi:peroxiredoxin
MALTEWRIHLQIFNVSLALAQLINRRKENRLMKALIRQGRCPQTWKLILSFIPAVALLFLIATTANSADNEYTGKFETQLVINDDDLEQVIFKPLRDLSKIKLAKPIESGATVTAGRLYHALSDKSAILTLLIEPEGEDPYLYADVDLNNVMDENERFALKHGEDDNPFIWEATVVQPLKEGLFRSFPQLVKYFKNVPLEELKEGERMVLESRTAFARGSVQIQDKSVMVQYQFDPRSRKINPTNGKLGVDSDSDGNVDFDPFSPEAAEAQDEVIVFRVGNTYLSTKRVDLEKNQIVMKSHPASDYKRMELRIGEVVPDFEFTDFNGKKRKLSEFRGKHVLIDFWGMWCPPCRQELPYLKAAYSRYQARGFEILGMNTDDAQIQSQVKSVLEKNGMMWPQAKRESIIGVIRNLRIHSYPTTLLVGPDGKVISLNNTRKGQPALRGRDLLKSLDEVLEP